MYIIYILLFVDRVSGLTMKPIEVEMIADTFDKNERGMIYLHKIMITFNLPDMEIINYEVHE